MTLANSCTCQHLPKLSLLITITVQHHMRRLCTEDYKLIFYLCAIWLQFESSVQDELIESEFIRSSEKLFHVGVVWAINEGFWY